MSELPPGPAPVSALRRLKRAFDASPWLQRAFDALVLVAIVVGVGLWQTRAHVRGVAVPAVTLPSLDGATVSTASLSGKPTLLAFWAPWCGVCESESRNLGWARGLAGDRANVVSVATAYDEVGQVRAYVQRNGVDYPVLLDEAGLAEALQVASFPTVYFLDAQGRIKGSVVGYTTTAGLLLRLLW
ncbi:MAG: TlpA family protein disulfide reductase [Myxococcaceae bacterium]|jgi:peroxiredoxin|nr:TlpA family protein disulfide reductase [Myxococcaceae bacterium]MCA3011791.1 TlpA family protein disulfide reductase [Myxococcaceae bacterium]